MDQLIKIQDSGEKRPASNSSFGDTGRATPGRGLSRPGRHSAVASGIGVPAIAPHIDRG